MKTKSLEEANQDYKRGEPGVSERKTRSRRGEPGEERIDQELKKIEPGVGEGNLE